MLIVCDTGPIIHLKEAELLDLLHKAGTVYIPKMVDAELTDLLPLFWEKQKPQWLQIELLSQEENSEAESLSLSGLLDFAEACAIILAKRHKADWFITDDTAARIFAKSMSMEVHGSLGVVLWSAAVGHLNYEESKESLERLSKTSLWISKNVLAEAFEALNTMFGKK